jgi:UDP-N-acetylmuramoyl-tripeptide--D-alanyl-D-alanine ligase
MIMGLAEVAEMLGQPLVSPAMITGWCIDSRTIQPGDLFFALRGPRYDGHDYASAVAVGGAVGIVAEREVDAACPVILVRDTYGALRRLAAWARARWHGQIVAVTGSAGKTTTKDVIADMLAVEMRTAKSEGNLNNEIGLPLSLLRMDDAAQVAVVELGMNHAQEIRRLSEVANPDVGVVTNVGYAHIENFDSIEGIAAAKRELIESLGPKGIAVLNADDSRVAAMQNAHQGRTILYGQSEQAGVRAEDVELQRDGIRFRVGPVKFESRLTGRHNVSNILAGIGVAGIYGIAPERLQDHVAALTPPKMRGELWNIHGMTIYNDCYNSNPEAARAMLDVLRDTPARRRIAVLGEMLELGHWAELLHRGVGDYAVECGVDVLVGIRGAACHMLDGAKSKGLRASAAFFFEDPADAGRQVRSLAMAGDAILFKGSRGVHVERALEEFLHTPNAPEGRG